MLRAENKPQKVYLAQESYICVVIIFFLGEDRGEGAQKTNFSRGPRRLSPGLLISHIPPDALSHLNFQNWSKLWEWHRAKHFLRKTVISENNERKRIRSAFCQCYHSSLSFLFLFLFLVPVVSPNLTLWSEECNSSIVFSTRSYFAPVMICITNS